MTRRVTITLPNPTGQQLDERASRNGQPVSTFAGELVRDALNPLANTKTRRANPAPMSHESADDQTAPWIEPTDATRAAWRSETWLAILALYARYAKELARLENDWWRRPSRVETLAALAEWRNKLDHHGSDPRDELAFQARIAELQHTLEHTPGTGSNTFNPNAAPPEDWLDTTDRRATYRSA